MTEDRYDRDRADDDRALGQDLRDAYERGRRDARAARRRHPLGMTLTFALAAVGLVMLVLAGLNGSFEGGGQVVDHGLQTAFNHGASDPAADAPARVADAAR